MERLENPDWKTSAQVPAPQAPLEELTLRIAERACRLAQQHGPAEGCELELWLAAEIEVKRELR